MSFQEILASSEFQSFLQENDLVLPKTPILNSDSSIRVGSSAAPNKLSRVLKYYDSVTANNGQEFVRVHWFSKSFPDKFFIPNKKSKPLTEKEKRELEQKNLLLKKKKEEDRKKNLAIAINDYLTCGSQCKSHPYLDKKNIFPYYGLRLSEKNISYLDGEGITRFRMRKGELIIPIVSLEKKLLSYQRISNKGAKLMASSVSPKGGVYPIGLWLGNKTRRVYLCEGYATGASIYEAQQDVVLVCFSINNIRHVCELIRKNYPDVEIILCTDFDKYSTDQVGLVQGLLLAQEHMVKFLFPKELSKGSDWNDLYVAKGLFAVRASINNQLKQFENENSIQVSEQYMPLINEKNIEIYFPERLTPSKKTLQM